MFGYIFFIVFGVLCMAFFYCMRRSEWHSEESKYWRHIALLTRLDPTKEEYYWPIFVWIQKNRPGFFGYLKSWKSPEERMHNGTNN